MTADEQRESPGERERRLTARAKEIDSLLTGTLAELRIHIDLLRNEFDSQEHPREQ